MLQYAVIINFVFALSACGPLQHPAPAGTQLRVVGGQKATPHAYPFMVSVYSERNSQTWCGGSLIAPKVVLTAAHCFGEMWFPGWQHTVRIGKHNMRQQEANEEEIAIDKVVSHPNFSADEAGFQNDIALIFLKTASHFPPIKLNRDPLLPKDDSLQRLIGWGLTHEESFFLPQDELLEVDLPIVNNATCASLNRNLNIQSHQLCAGYINSPIRKDACKGDSGGPLFTMNNQRLLLGIVSGGNGCAQANSPGFYTRVSSFIDWIEQKTGPLEP